MVQNQVLKTIDIHIFKGKIIEHAATCVNCFTKNKIRYKMRYNTIISK